MVSLVQNQWFSGRPLFDWYVETVAEHQTGFWPNPNAWLIGAVLPAWHAGEQRVQIEGTLCPVLLSNLKVAFGTLESWFPEMGSPPSIEATAGYSSYYPRQAEAVSLLSCGVDSLATLRWNMLHLPPEHPRSIRAALYVEFVDDQNEVKLEAILRRKFVQRLADANGIDALPIRSNIYDLDGDGWFFTYKWHGALLSAAANFFSQRFNRAYVASSNYQYYLPPSWGSHPLLDKQYSSGDMDIEHDGLHMFRTQKTALVADWRDGLRNLLVCQNQPVDEMNCGECGKCISTMTALVAVGKLGDAVTFPVKDVTPELLATEIDYEMLGGLIIVQFFEDLIPALIEHRRDDLVAVIRRFRPYVLGKQQLVDRLAAAVSISIPDDQRFVLTDNRRFRGAIGPQSRGKHWGLPRDSATAVRELRNLQASGVSYCAFTPETSWWLEYFDGLLDHLAEIPNTLYAENQALIYRITNLP